MKPFNIKLSDEHRAKLEIYRAMRGLRSEADAVRDLIDRADLPSGHAVGPEAPAASVTVQKLWRKPFNPQPKPGARR
jgi:hypothetical protein